MKILKRTLLILAALIVVVAIVFTTIYFTRFQTSATIQKITAYDEYNLYRMDIKYDYSIENIINYGITDNQSFVDAVTKEALPLLPVHIEVPDFGCSAFSVNDTDNNNLMGRNYDFKNDSSAMLVYSTPKDGYKSVAFAALDNISANTADASLKSRLACLTAPFVCLDGMNEKGVSIAVLTLDSEPTKQNTGKPTIATTLAIRLVLDKAASTEEAVELLKNYDMMASSGRDYHFYITDSSGDGRVIEYSLDSERKLVATPARAVTNFFEMYKDKVKPNQHNENYGHGKERYDAMEEIFNKNEGKITNKVAWDALKAASQKPSKDDITSNTQWSILYNNTDLTAEIVIRRDWNTVTSYNLNLNEINGAEN